MLPLFDHPTGRLGAVAEFFKSHPEQWVNGLDLAHIGGAYAWRTRVSECRTKLGMTIENTQRRQKGGPTVSLYRYVP